VSIISKQPWYSSVAADDWAPVHDALLQGVVHACNNRVAALGGIVQLQEHALATPQEGFASLKAEVPRLRAMMELFRALMARRGDKREPARLSECARGAAALLAHHPVARQWTVRVDDEPADAEPVLLWPTDALRFALLLLLAAGGGTPSGGELRVSVLRNGKRTTASVVAAGSAAAVAASPEFLALQRAAEREGGTLVAAEYGGSDGVQVTLSLYGLTAASSR
jgi:hypothetical protein